MNKRLWIWFLVFMLLSGGCQVREDAAGYGADIKKAQEIAVIPFGETQETKVLTEEAEIEAFAQGLELETWVWKPLPTKRQPGHLLLFPSGNPKTLAVLPGEAAPGGRPHPICRGLCPSNPS